MAQTITGRLRKNCACLDYNFSSDDKLELSSDSEGCANYESDADHDSSDYIGTSDEDSNFTSITGVSEQAQPLQLGERPSGADLKGLLEEKCPEEYAALPKIAGFEFNNWQDGRARKRLRIGAISTPFDTVGHVVYAFVCGEESNRTGLTQGMDSKPFALKSAGIVSLIEPFRSICWRGRLFEDVEERRLRALLCFWFSSAGHLSNFKKYTDFDKHLVEAVQWLGRAMIEQKASKHTEAAHRTDLGTIIRDPIVSVSKKTPTVRKRSLPLVQEPGQADAVENEDYLRTQFKILRPDMFRASTKRKKLDEAVSAMGQRHNKQMTDLATIERELATLKRNARPQEDLESTVYEQEKKISELKRQLCVKRTALGVARDQILQQSRLIDVVRTQLQQAELNREKARAVTDAERALRVEAERKLKEYVDAQKKMAAQFA